MEYLVICIAALLTSALTLFSGFGLGTLLLPAFALFFPIDLAVGLTAIVHFLNNLFKISLLGRHADLRTALLFGGAAIPSAILGAAILVMLSGLQPLTVYQIGGHEFMIMPVNAIVAALMIAFAVLEVTPRFDTWSFDRKWLPLGGILSGFFGGLSGHQGALRSAFLLRSGLTKEAFIATGILIACVIDITRLSVYATHFSSTGIGEQSGLLIAATLSAFTGAFLGARLMKKVTMRFIRWSVATLLLLIALGLGSGILA